MMFKMGEPTYRAEPALVNRSEGFAPRPAYLANLPPPQRREVVFVFPRARSEAAIAV